MSFVLFPSCRFLLLQILGITILLLNFCVLNVKYDLEELIILKGLTLNFFFFTYYIPKKKKNHFFFTLTQHSSRLFLEYPREGLRRC